MRAGFKNTRDSEGGGNSRKSEPAGKSRAKEEDLAESEEKRGERGQ